MKKPDYNEWKQKLSASNRKFESVDKNIKLWRDYFRGKQWQAKGSNEYRYQPVDNVIWSNIKSLMPGINFNNPRIFAKAKKPPYFTKDGLFDTIQASAAFEILINYYYEHLKLKRETDKCLMDALIGPWAVIRLGYTLKTEKVQDEELIEINEIIKSESPYAVRVSPCDFRCDIEARDSQLLDAEWVAFRWVKKLDDVKNNPKYSNTKYLKPNYTVKTNFNQTIKTSDTLEDNIWNRVEGWDIYDKKTHKVMSIVEEHTGFLRCDDWELDMEGFPCEILYFNENPDELIPISDIEIYIDNQEELNRIKSLQISHIKNISNRKYVTQKGAFDPEEKLKLEVGGDGVIVESDKNPENSLIVVKDANISQDIYIVQRLLKDSITESSGVSQTDKLIARKFDTAEEPQQIQQSSSVKKMERSQIFEDFVKRVVKKLGVILQQTMEEQSVPLNNSQFSDIINSLKSEQKTIDFAGNQLQGITLRNAQLATKLDRITGKQGGQILLPWLKLKKEDILGDYDFDIEIGSTMPTNQQSRKQDAVALYNLLANNPYINKYEGTKEIFEAFEKRDIDRLILPQEEAEQKMAANQKAAIDAEIQKDMPKRQTDLEKTKIKSQTALAKEQMAQDTNKSDKLVNFMMDMVKKGVDKKIGEDDADLPV